MKGLEVSDVVKSYGRIYIGGRYGLSFPSKKKLSKFHVLMMKWLLGIDYEEYVDRSS